MIRNVNISLHYLIATLALGLSASCASLASIPVTSESILIPSSSIFDTHSSIHDWKPDNPVFRSYYGWEENAGSWDLEQIPCPDGGSVAIHIFRPSSLNPGMGTVFLLHGYLDHSAMRIQPVLEFVKKGWIVVGMDLPGHGLSTGKRADIDDFSEYLAAFESTMAAHAWPSPWRAVGHSAGGATISMALQNPACTFDLVVLEATLIRTFMWTPFLWFKQIMGNWVHMITRRNGTYDKNDPFSIDKVPLRWFNAVEAYYQSTLDWKPVQGRVLILQGDSDSTVDAKYNIPFLRDIFPDAEIIEIAGGNHHLLMDEGPAGKIARHELFSRW